MKLAAAGRADLVRAARSGGPDAVARLAVLLGYQAPPPPPLLGEPEAAAELVTEPVEVVSVAGPGEAAAGLAELPFWRLEHVEYLPPLPPPPSPSATRADLAPAHWRGRPSSAPRIQPLAAWPELLPRLRGAVARPTETHAVDLPKVVERLCRGEILERLPRQLGRHWGDRVQIILDRSDRLIPYWLDQLDVYLRLQKLYSQHAVQLAVFREGGDPLTFLDPVGGERSYRFPLPGTTVLVLGDLGCLDHRASDARDFWTDFGRQLRDAGAHPVGLLPCGPRRWGTDIPSSWALLAWEKPLHPAAAGDAGWERPARRLLRLVSPAIRIELGLLRAVRMLLPTGEAEAALEADAWQHPALIGTSCVAGTLDPIQANELRDEFAREAADLRQRALAEIRNWRAGLAPEVWFVELLGLDPRSQRLVPEQDQEDAEQFVHWLEQRITSPAEAGAPADCEEAFFCRVEPRLELSRRTGDAVRRDWHSIWRTVHRNQSQLTAPFDYDPREASSPSLEETVFETLQRGSSIVFRSRPTAFGPTGEGSPLGFVRSRNREFLVTPLPYGDFWKSGRPPAWAADWGQDEFGAWVAFEFAGIRQRMRWIPAGTFGMGSPQDEPGRWANEGPRHQVTISRGFWLFDTACTQALWQAVMGGNPSGFPSPDRPVEQVSWTDCQKFLNQINERLPGLALTLPTEAQWEYACRAGTETATYAGPLEILGENNAPAADPIAWYGGNSGEGFDLENGYDSSAWPAKQYQHRRAGTHPVGRKEPNARGLYDMLGNVWEWCQDGLREYRSGSIRDPLGATEGGADRVLRGGSWLSGARDVRCAYRLVDPPGSRYGLVGFRPARVQQLPEAEPAGPAVGRKGGARPTRDQPGGAAARDTGACLVRLPVSTAEAPPRAADPGVRAVCALPGASSLTIASDCERLTFGQLARPPWASAMGRDRFGLWVEFEVRTRQDEPVAQRLRWIPPGRFVMGSPTDEPGRPSQEELKKNRPYWPDEGPPHLVTISRGFWLFDTPCTQALWEAVMGDNPSRFRTPDRPVEQVSWEDSQRFLGTINRLVPGVELALPSEAQWEYACRAGTQEATFAGPLQILGACHAPVLDAICWYAGNSGLDFDLQDGYDSSGWPEKQHDHRLAGTRAVRQKLANPWGLYDMLGNVWEWCGDGPRQYSDEAVVDPVGPLQGGAVRVLRGGSWNSRARGVRCADRGVYHPGYRGDDLGFRPARVQQSVEQVIAPVPAEPAGPAVGRKGGARPTPDQPGGASPRRPWWPWRRKNKE